MLTIQPEDPTTPDAVALITDLSADLGARYNDDGGGAFSPADVQVPGGAFVVARVDGAAVGCGALKPLADDIGEVKRMYVRPAYRGQGIAVQILKALEEAARARGYQAVWLETGLKQPEAMRLYEKTGYQRRACYGIYADDPESVCYEKTL